MKHPNETQINEYLDGALEPSEKARMEAHLSDCTNCRARLASLQAVFQALTTLPEELLRRDLNPAVLQSLPRQPFRLAWRLAFAVQAGISLSLLILLSPIVTIRLAGIMQGLPGQIAWPDVKLPTPMDYFFSMPIIRLPHPPEFTLPIGITHSNLPAWYMMVIAAFLLFVIGNISLIFHRTSEIQNIKRRRMP